VLRPGTPPDNELRSPEYGRLEEQPAKANSTTTAVSSTAKRCFMATLLSMMMG
jgi:hypothetical protein